MTFGDLLATYRFDEIVEESKAMRQLLGNIFGTTIGSREMAGGCGML